MTIEWYGHSCFKITSGGFSVVIDPYEPTSVPGFDPLHLTANKVLCTHAHLDHAYRGGVEIVKRTECPFAFSTLKTFHDEVQGRRRGKNSVFILEAEGLRVAHFGDIGCQLDSAQIKQIGRLDAAMIPVGGCYTVDAVGAGEIINSLESVRVAIPMHYRGDGFGFGVLATVDGFFSALPDRPVARVGEVLELDAASLHGIAVMEP